MLSKSVSKCACKKQIKFPLQVYTTGVTIPVEPYIYCIYEDERTLLKITLIISSHSLLHINKINNNNF